MVRTCKRQLLNMKRTPCIGYFRCYISNVYSTENRGCINNTLPDERIAQNTVTRELDDVMQESDELYHPLIFEHTNQRMNLCSEPKKDQESSKIGDEDNNFRKNDLNIQMLSRHLYKQLFPMAEQSSVPKDAALIKTALSELKKHGLPGSLHKIPDVTLDLPEIINGDIEDHFYAIGESQCGPYRELLNGLLETIPTMPSQWSFTAGWTKYDGEDGKPVPVEYPEDDALILDVEVCVKEGETPTMATAVSKNAWYGWVSKDLIKGKSHRISGSKRDYFPDNLIPLETDSKTKTTISRKLSDSCSRCRIVVGHNVSYDRARIKEQYFLERTTVRFLDTMSLHVSISGITSYQKTLLKSNSSSSPTLDDNALDDNDWTVESSLSGLSNVHEFYCGKPIDKEQRNLFLVGTYRDIADNFQSLMTYCAKDVLATHNIFLHLWPEFLYRFPHPVTLAGMMELNTCYLPVNENWTRYLQQSEQTYNDMDIEGKLLLSQEADRMCQLLHNDAYKNDLWLWNLDWKVKQLKLKKAKPVGKKKKNENEAELLLPMTTSLSPKLRNCDWKEIINIEKDNEINDEYDKFDTSRQTKMVEKFTKLVNSTERLPIKIPHLTGYPEWYRKLCSRNGDQDWKPGPHLISNSTKVTPKLLRLTWKSMPLHHIGGYGWGFLVPYATQIKLPEEEQSILPLAILHEYYLANSNGESTTGGIYKNNCDENNNIINVTREESQLKELERALLYSAYGYRKNKNKLNDNNNKKKKKKSEVEQVDDNLSQISSLGHECGFFKLPHKNGDDLNVGNPLSRDFLDKFTESGLGEKNNKAAKIVEISRQLSYWRNNRERIEKQFIVWLKRKDLPASVSAKSSGNKTYGVILPQVIVCGTLTRRAVESTWMTASNAADLRIGSELKCMVQAPEGYSLVGADVDSQELWIASLIGDAYFVKEHGCTPFGWMTISGDKTDETDMHSMTAKTMGISRNNAKIINYARIYGAGQYFAERLMKQFKPDLSTAEAKERANKMFRKTKGYRCFRLKPDCLPEQNRREYYRREARELCSFYNKNADELFDKPKWIGGSESAMFNRLEEIANTNEPITPFLQCRLSKALQPNLKNADKFMTTRINWVVQSGAVDFLHLMLVCMRWLVDARVRFSLSFHDEIHYLVPEKQKYQTALALHVTNLLTRAFCVRRLGMTDMPQSVAFFSAVEVDTVLRKEASNDCKTPSNPHGLSKGYGIPVGESLNIHEAIKKANGVIGVHNITRTRKSKQKII